METILGILGSIGVLYLLWKACDVLDWLTRPLYDGVMKLLGLNDRSGKP